MNCWQHVTFSTESIKLWKLYIYIFMLKNDMLEKCGEHKQERDGGSDGRSMQWHVCPSAQEVSSATVIEVCSLLRQVVY